MRGAVCAQRIFKKKEKTKKKFLKKCFNTGVFSIFKVEKNSVKNTRVQTKISDSVIKNFFFSFNYTFRLQ